MGNVGILAAKVGVKHGSSKKWGFDRTCSEESMILIMGRLEFNPHTMEIQRTKSNMHLDWHPKMTMIHGEPQIPTRMKLGNTWREHMGVYPLVSINLSLPSMAMERTGKSFGHRSCSMSMLN